MPAILSVRAIKRKVRSVGNIKKITRAMQMVSAAKLKKVQVRLMELRPYSDKIREFLQSLASQVKDLNYPLFQPREKVRKIGIVAVMADKGLCGSYNSNMMRHVQRFLDEQKKPYVAIAVGKKSAEWFRKQGTPLRAEYLQLPTEIPFSQIKAMTKQLVELFLSQEVDEVHLLFTRYVNAMTFKPGSVKFLPIEPEQKGSALSKEYEFEPEPERILDRLIPRYVEVSFHRLLLESMSSEHAARMNAMRNATDSASDLISALTLQYNNARQAGITKELLDIVGGAEALKG
ncbi:MAG TPA: ATP synthase F1 subunit gamma [Planctomycetota bacterium]|jgi:F-type H+-transporting ATPase subunit gamma|nr:ATP synthase F1 subunit gamma [Planctomycetota bacterium]